MATSYALAFIFMLSYLFVCILVPYIASKSEKNSKWMTVTLMKDLNITSFMTKHYYSIFLFRRLIFVILVFTSAEYLALQIMIFILTNMLYFIYLIYFKPIENGIVFELINEGKTLVLSYFMLIFTDFMPDHTLN